MLYSFFCLFLAARNLFCAFFFYVRTPPRTRTANGISECKGGGTVWQPLSVGKSVPRREPRRRQLADPHFRAPTRSRCALPISEPATRQALEAQTHARACTQWNLQSSFPISFLNSLIRYIFKKKVDSSCFFSFTFFCGNDSNQLDDFVIAEC